jgi:nucleoside-diphosphate-sugar epimerase
VVEAVSIVVDAERFAGSSVLVVGANGLIGSHIVSVLENLKEFGFSVDVTGTSRHDVGLKRLTGAHPSMSVLRLDVQNPVHFPKRYDFVIDVASPADPSSFSKNPVDTMVSNFDGVRHLLDAVRVSGSGRFLYVSSGEVYGTARSNALVSEGMMGRVDSLDPRSCYPMSKRAAETLCASYVGQYGADVVVARPSHVFGPGFSSEDTRISASFFVEAGAGKDIILKGPGTDLRTYVYVDDCATGLLSVLAVGKSGEAYNVTNSENLVTIGGFAEAIAAESGVSVSYPVDHKQIPTTGVHRISALDDAKIRMLGWCPQTNLKQGIQKTLRSMQHKTL